jgi:N-acetylmuramoyl-L-alanine amidase
MTSQGPSLNARGFMVFTTVGQTRSDKLAELVIQAVERAKIVRVRTENADGDGDYERDFYMVKQTRMPAILIEAGFFTNLEEALWLQHPNTHQQLGTLVAQAILQFT